LHCQVEVDPGAFECIGMCVSAPQLLEHMTAARRSKPVYEPIDCSKGLIIISGNLDEAFTTAAESAKADIVHASTPSPPRSRSWT
jgi:hypothetical protein